ncbi:MAG: hypothetical protein MZU95_04160 [Desulfomicrobium escambiense]|nr:hypothetical protein [Desulfomicrobium escambiense]
MEVYNTPLDNPAYQRFAGMNRQQAAVQAPEQVQYAPPSPQEDTVQFDQKPKEKTGPIRKFKNFMAGIQKAWATVTGYTKATFKGIFDGALVASTVLAGTAGYNFIKRHVNKVSSNKEVKDKAIQQIKDKAKLIPKSIKYGAVALGGVTLIYDLFKASLDINEKKANIDHRWKANPHG